MFRYKLKNNAFDNEWLFVGTGCVHFRKRPLVFLRPDAQLAVVWESTCPMSTRVYTSADGDGYQNPTVTQMARRRFVHSVVLRDVASTTTVTIRNAANRTIWKRVVSLPNAESKTITIHAMADNQFNVRTFHRLLSRSARQRQRQRRSTDLFLHAGDLTQNPDSMQQWQTDFWDPVSSSAYYRSTAVVPLLVARGNHDWDPKGESTYTGGPIQSSETLRKGTWFTYAPHPRVIFVVLDSNLALDSVEERAQQEWFEQLVLSEQWTRASVRIVVVHVPPFLEHWDREKWPAEHTWGSYVRTRLTAVIMRSNTTLVISGHSHIYQRGALSPNDFEPLVRSAWSGNSLSAAIDRHHEPTQSREDKTVLTIIGGAGGTLDRDRVEDWHVYERTVVDAHHWVEITIRLDDSAPLVPGTYLQHAQQHCKSKGKDTIEWKAFDERDDMIDSFVMTAMHCR